MDKAKLPEKILGSINSLENAAAAVAQGQGFRDEQETTYTAFNEARARLESLLLSQQAELEALRKLSWLPQHKCGLYLSHNEHRDTYESIEDFSKQMSGEWASPEERAKAIETDELWILHWYPDTLVGFCRIQASSLEAIIARATELRAKGGTEGTRRQGRSDQGIGSYSECWRAVLR